MRRPSDATIRRVKEAFRIALAVTVGMFVFRFFEFPRGNWIVLTIGAIYLGGSNHGLVIHRANSRIAGTFAGLAMAFLLVSLFLSHDYRWGYALPFLWFLIYYIGAITGSYTHTVFYLSMCVPIIIALMAGDASDLNFDEALFERFFYTGVGASIVLLLEVSVFPKTTSVRGNLQAVSRSLFAGIQTEVVHVVERFAAGKPMEGNSWTLNAVIMGKYGTARELYKSMEHELGHDVREDGRYEKIFGVLRQISGSLKILAALTNNMRGQVLSEQDKSLLSQTAAAIAAAFSGIAFEESPGQPGTAGRRIESLLAATDVVQNHLTPQLFFVEELRLLAARADELKAL